MVTPSSFWTSAQAVPKNSASATMFHFAAVPAKARAAPNR